MSKEQDGNIVGRWVFTTEDGTFDDDVIAAAEIRCEPIGDIAAGDEDAVWEARYSVSVAPSPAFTSVHGLHGEVR